MFNICVACLCVQKVASHTCSQISFLQDTVPCCSVSFSISPSRLLRSNSKAGCFFVFQLPSWCNLLGQEKSPPQGLKLFNPFSCKAEFKLSSTAYHHMQKHCYLARYSVVGSELKSFPIKLLEKFPVLSIEHYLIYHISLVALYLLYKTFSFLNSL